MAAATGGGTEINAAAIVRNNGDTEAPVIMAIAHNTANVSFWVAPQYVLRSLTPILKLPYLLHAEFKSFTLL